LCDWQAELGLMRQTLYGLAQATTRTPHPSGECPPMSRTPLEIVNIDAGQNPAALNKDQKTFNTRIRQIEQRRERLAAWQDTAHQVDNKYALELRPLLDNALDLRVRLAHTLDRASTRKGLTQSERRLLSALIVDLAADLLGERPDVGLKALYNRHSASDYDRDQAEAHAGLKSALEEILGTKLDEQLDLNEPDELLRHLETEFEAQRQARQDEQAKPRKKTAKQLAREAKKQEDRAQIGRSIQALYRKLASALHPDREPDPEVRERKTDLMQRANAAYAKNNLLQLLELQLELEDINPNVLVNIGTERLKHYNIVLKEQLAELDEEIMQLENEFRVRLGLAPFVTITPVSILRRFASDLRVTRQSNRDLERDMQALEDPGQLKMWLRAQRQR
jgi:hypothetical protein